MSDHISEEELEDILDEDLDKGGKLIQEKYNDIKKLDEEVEEALSKPVVSWERELRERSSLLLTQANRLKSYSDDLRDLRDTYNWSDESSIEYEITRVLNESNFVRIQGFSYITLMGIKTIMNQTRKSLNITKILAATGILIGLFGMILQYSGHIYVKTDYEPLPNEATPMQFHK